MLLFVITVLLVSLFVQLHLANYGSHIHFCFSLRIPTEFCTCSLSLYLFPLSKFCEFRLRILLAFRFGQSASFKLITMQIIESININSFITLTIKCWPASQSPFIKTSHNGKLPFPLLCFCFTFFVITSMMNFPSGYQLKSTVVNNKFCICIHFHHDISREEKFPRE